MLFLASSKPHKIAVNWIGPGTVTRVISETNYAVNMSLKPYYKRPEFVNIVNEMDSEEGDEDVEIPYPLPNITQIDFWEIVNNIELKKRSAGSQISKFNDVIEKTGKCFFRSSTHPFYRNGY